jgi:hypothetical protein
VEIVLLLAWREGGRGSNCIAGIACLGGQSRMGW